MMWFPLLFVAFVFFMLSRHRCMAVDGCGMHGTHGGYGPYAQGFDSSQPDPVQIVRERLARGEISVEEYESIRRTLG